MTDTPETRYTRSADGTNLAYQVSGDGPLDLVFRNASGVSIDLLVEHPASSAFGAAWVASAAPYGSTPGAWAIGG